MTSPGGETELAPTLTPEHAQAKADAAGERLAQTKGHGLSPAVGFAILWVTTVITAVVMVVLVLSALGRLNTLVAFVNTSQSKGAQARSQKIIADIERCGAWHDAIYTYHIIPPKPPDCT